MKFQVVVDAPEMQVISATFAWLVMHVTAAVVCVDGKANCVVVSHVTTMQPHAVPPEPVVMMTISPSTWKGQLVRPVVPSTHVQEASMVAPSVAELIRSVRTDVDAEVELVRRPIPRKRMTVPTLSELISELKPTT